MGFLDSIGGFLAKVGINTHIRDFGMINDLTLSPHPDGKSKNVSVNISLKGETEPIQLFISGVKLVRRGELRLLSIQSIASTSPTKAWLTPFLSTFKIFPTEIPLDGKAVEILAYLLPEESEAPRPEVIVTTPA